jgi:hypothetical protein
MCATIRKGQFTVLLHIGGFWNNCTPKRCCHIRRISEQMHYKTPFSHNGYKKSLEIYENYITLFCLEENKNFYKIILIKNHGWHITQSG